MTAATGTFVQLPPADVIPSKNNPRLLNPNAPDVKELAESIRAVGVLEPVLVRPHPSRKGKFDLLAGARRLMAAKLAGLKEIPALVREVDEQTALTITVTENLQREDLSPLEEARGINTLLDHKWTVETIAESLGRSGAWVSRRAQLVHLTDGWKRCIEDAEHPVSEWPSGHLELIARMEAHVQEHLLEGFNSGYRDETVPSLSDLEREVGEYLRDLATAPWGLKDADLVPAAGSCEKCVKRTACRPLLFADLRPAAGKKAKGKGNDYCLDADCWNGKVSAHLVGQASRLREEYGEKLLLVDGGYEKEVPKGIQGKVVSQYDLTQVKKGDPGAQPGLHVAGRQAGSLVWVKPYRLASGKPGRMVGPQRLSVRREALGARRVSRVLALVKDALEKHTEPPAGPDLLRLLAVFGTFENNCHADAADWKRYDKQEDECVRRELWESIKKVLKQRMVTYNVAAAPDKLPDAERIAGLIGVDVKALSKQAEQELPEPRAWLKLNADGTPKPPVGGSRGTADDGAKKKRPEKGSKGFAAMSRRAAQKKAASLLPAAQTKSEGAPSAGDSPEKRPLPPKFNEEGVCTEGFETIPVPLPKGALASVEIYVVKAADGKFRAGHTFDLSGPGGGSGSEATLPSSHGEGRASREEAVRLELGAALVFFRQMRAASTAALRARCLLAMSAVSNALEEAGQLKGLCYRCGCTYRVLLRPPPGKSRYWLPQWPDSGEPAPKQIKERRAVLDQFERFRIDMGVTASGRQGKVKTH